ncbi:DUF1758 domain-containing protein [Trichonephila clavipes]|nr:DUF1758 domain-containing protein [Trichonephila clavipes]
MRAYDFRIKKFYQLQPESNPQPRGLWKDYEVDYEADTLPLNERHDKLNQKECYLVENALEKSKQEVERNEREAEIQLEKIKLSQIEKQLELAKVRKESEKNPQTLESGEPSSITDKLESLCYQFKKLSVEDRVEVVKRNNLCFRCFLPHRLKECRSEKNCFCLRPHNSLIHFSRDKTRNPTPTSNLNLDASTFVPGQIEESVEANFQAQFVATGFEKGRLKNVLLSTVHALFFVKDKYSQWVEVRCLLDEGSQSCLCTRACAEKLQLKMEKINTVVSRVNDASMVVKNCVKISVANKAKTFESELMLLVVNKITALIPKEVIDVDVNVSEFLALADDKFNIPDRIDMLLGAEIFYELLKPGKFYCDNSHLVLQNTVFGYVVSGSVDHTQVTKNRVHCGLIVDDDLNKTLKKFCEIEGVHIEPKVDTVVSLCEDHFVRTHRRNCEGRYVVSMALNKDPPCLGNSKDIAIRRLN